MVGVLAGFAPPADAVDLGLERIEATAPGARPVEAREERLERREGVEGERVLALPAARRVLHEARLAEHPEVPADGGSADGERLGDRARRARSLLEHQEDLAADGVCEGLGDGVHGLDERMSNRCVTRCPRAFRAPGVRGDMLREGHEGDDP